MDNYFHKGNDKSNKDELMGSFQRHTLGSLKSATVAVLLAVCGSILTGCNGTDLDSSSSLTYPQSAHDKNGFQPVKILVETSSSPLLDFEETQIDQTDGHRNVREGVLTDPPFKMIITVRYSNGLESTSDITQRVLSMVDQQVTKDRERNGGYMTSLIDYLDTASAEVISGEEITSGVSLTHLNCSPGTNCTSFTPSFSSFDQPTTNTRLPIQFEADPSFSMTQLDDIQEQIEKLDGLLKQMNLLLEPAAELEPSYAHRINRFISGMFESEPQFADASTQYFQSSEG